MDALDSLLMTSLEYTVPKCERPHTLTHGLSVRWYRYNMAETIHRVTIYHPPGRSWDVADDSGFTHISSICNNFFSVWWPDL